MTGRNNRRMRCGFSCNAMNDLKFYAHQSPITDPGAFADAYADLPADMAKLSRIAQGLVFHYFADESIFGVAPAPERMREIDDRYVHVMLKRLLDLDDGPLGMNRPPERRILGCCRDFSALLCSMARHCNIPARLRVGFATYFIPDFYADHVVVEYWDASEGRWRLADPELSPLHAERYAIDFNPLDVPHAQFLVGGRAWKMYRAGEADPDRFGVTPESPIRGWRFILNRLMLDLAALNAREMLQWDSWGLMESDLSDNDLKLLDRVADLTLSADDSFEALQTLFQTAPGMRLPATITSFSPATQDPISVRLEV